ncbi:nitroreductase [Paenibacillus sp. MY03]|jgi:nitroreductase|uniref:nitroreductase family protein n=1 Tax=unclassified Paenibacillus TaxID=185978 RepID=UPI000B3C4F3F|nr:MULTISPECIES: nitroreductase family protein [unclassified Paenibacillus]OUS78747.1 nitroreductase [Paenibacillus sp. MY03]QNK56317.1 nitroreductase family protein [Paenibacillus sp. PAMC21692]
MSISANPLEGYASLSELAYNAEVAEARRPDHPVHPLILNRWSPRSYEDRSISDEVLFTVLEAARWAPSSGNVQPWRFYVARTAEEHAAFDKFLKPRNRQWATKAPVLLLLASVKVRDNGDPNGAHAFDAGAAWATLAFQARLLGLSTRAIGGFDHDIARETLQTSDDLALHAVIALGYKGEAGSLDDAFREQEKPNGRRPLADSILPVKTDGLID